MNDEPKVVRARDVMNERFIMVDKMDTVRVALERLKAVDARCLIVDKYHANDEYGLVLLSDVAKKVIAKDRSPDRVNVYEIMSKPVIAVRPEMDIRYTARLFDSFGLAMAPVIEGGVVTGVVTYTDIVLEGLELL